MAEHGCVKTQIKFFLDPHDNANNRHPKLGCLDADEAKTVSRVQLRLLPNIRRSPRSKTPALSNNRPIIRLEPERLVRRPSAQRAAQIQRIGKRRPLGPRVDPPRTHALRNSVEIEISVRSTRK
jgi:hypothetical protein